MEQTSYEDLKSYWKDSNNNGYQKLIAEKQFLHESSSFLIEVLENSGVLEDINYAFEMGCGCARNLAYLYKARKDVEIGGEKGIIIAGNDLSSEQCFKYMDEDIKGKILFFEQDSKMIVDEEDFELDLFMSIDHLMHLDVETVKYIMEKVKNKCSPKYILLRNATTDRLNKTPYVYLHDFSSLDDKYDLIVDTENYGKNKNSTFKVLLYKKRENI